LIFRGIPGKYRENTGAPGKEIVVFWVIPWINLFIGN
jgi:hypothetical protein